MKEFLGKCFSDATDLLIETYRKKKVSVLQDVSQE